MAAYKQQAPRLHYLLTTERELTQPILKAVVFPLDDAELQSEGERHRDHKMDKVRTVKVVPDLS